jgi:hypothetical protein
MEKFPKYQPRILKYAIIRTVKSLSKVETGNDESSDDDDDDDDNCAFLGYFKA